MSRVDFYILPEKSIRDRFACKLASKAWQNGSKVYMHAASYEAAVLLNDLLWTFSDISFVPHALVDADPAPDMPVLIGWRQPPDHCTLMINLTEGIPAAAAGFARIAEIVAGREEERTLARQRYRGYRDSGHEMHNHTLNNDDDDT